MCSCISLSEIFLNMKNLSLIKRIIVILLLNLYIYTVNGFAIERQFCCGKLTNINISWGDESKCPICPKNKKCNKNCCNSKFDFHKIIDSQKSSQQLKINEPKLSVLLFSLSEYILPTSCKVSDKEFLAFSIPPLLIQEPVFIVNRSIRI